MDTEKFINLQREIKQNNAEFSDFIGTLANLKEETDKKFIRISKDAKEKDLPPLRNIEYNRKNKLYNKQYSEKNKVVQSGDSSESDSSSETDEEYEKIQNQMLYNKSKDRGNELFKKEKFQEAIEEYTNLISYDPLNPVGYLNRALALIRLEFFGAAEKDCDCALSINPTLAKAYYRRALARKGLEKNLLALKDIKETLKLEPNNELALKEMNSLALCRDIEASEIKGRMKKINITEVCKKMVHEPDQEVPRKSVEITRVPENWYNLEQDMRNFGVVPGKSLNKDCIHYLNSIPPEKYVKIIGENLTSELLSRFIEAITSTSQDENESILRLSCLAKVIRFDINWMMMEDGERQKCITLIKSLKDNPMKKKAIEYSIEI